MGRRTVALIRWRGDHRSPENRWAREGLEAYAQAHGWAAGLEIMEVQDGSALLADGEPGHLLRSLSAGTRAIVPSFSHLADTPRELRRGVPKVIGMGIELYCTSIGNVAENLTALVQGWSAAEPIEKALASERQARKSDADTWATLFAQYERDVAASYAKQWGIPSGFVPYGVPDEVTAMAPAPTSNGMAKPDHALIGSALRDERVKRSLTQGQLAGQLKDYYQQSGEAKTPDASAISRAESSGEGTHIVPLISLLRPDWLPDAELAGVMDALTFATFRIRAEHAREAVQFDSDMAEGLEAFARRQAEEIRKAGRAEAEQALARRAEAQGAMVNAAAA
jgi:hypothetical protein